jgi:hypothetical protein
MTYSPVEKFDWALLNTATHSFSDPSISGRLMDPEGRLMDPKGCAMIEAD